jgi:O-antigen/teichoic acid export membrane protein
VRQQHGIVRPARRCAWKSWLLEAGPLGFGDVIRSLTWQLDTLLLGLLQPAAVVGIYSVAYRPLGPLNYVPRAILSAQFPQFTRLASDPPALQQAAMRSARVLTFVSVPIAVAVFVFAEPLVVLIGGPEYLEAARPLRLLIWITVLSFVTMHFRYVLAAVAKERAYAALVTAVFVVELVVELALIPSQGYMGACAGSLAGESMFVAAGYFVCRRQLRGASSRVLQPAARPA